MLICLRVLAKCGVLTLLGAKGRYTTKANFYFPDPDISTGTSGLESTEYGWLSGLWAGSCPASHTPVPPGLLQLCSNLSQLVLMVDIALSQVQILILEFVELHDVLLSPLLSLSGLSGWHLVSLVHQPHLTAWCHPQLAEGALNPIFNVTDVDIKDYWSQHWSLGETTHHWSSSRHWAIYHHTLVLIDMVSRAGEGAPLTVLL